LILLSINYTISKKIVTTIKEMTSNNNNNQPRSNLGIKVKSTKPQTYESKKEREQTHQNCSPSSVQLDLI